MASMGPFPSERIGRDIDDLPLWPGMNWNRYEWNEFYCSNSWNIAPFEFEKILVSPGSPIVDQQQQQQQQQQQKEVVKRRRSGENIISDTRSIEIVEEKGKTKKSKRGSNKIKKKKKKSVSEEGDKEAVSKPKTKKIKKKKKKKSKKTRSIGTSSSSLDTFCTFDSADIESSTEFSSASFRSSKSLVETAAAAASSGGYAELPDEGPGPLVSPIPSRSSASFLSPAASFRDRSERSLTSFGPLSPSLRSMTSLGGGESRSSIMGCEIPDDVMDYIDEVYQEPEPISVPGPPLLLENPEPERATEAEEPPKKTKKKKKKRKSKSEKQLKSSAKEAEEDVVEKKPSSTKQKSLPKEEADDDVVEKKPSSTKHISQPQEEEEEEEDEVAEKKPPSMRSKTSAIMETLPEEISLSMKLSQPAAPKRSHARSLSPKRRNHRFSKLMVVADGSIRRVVEKKNKSSFWEQSAKRRGSVKQSIHQALGEIEGSLDFEDVDVGDAGGAGERMDKAADFSVATELTDPWHNSWSISSDSFRDDSGAFRNSLLSPNNLEHVKRIKPL